MTPPTSSSYFPVKILILEGPDKDKIRVVRTSTNIPMGVSFKVLETNCNNLDIAKTITPDELEQWGNTVNVKQYCEELFEDFSPEQILHLYWLIETGADDLMFDWIIDRCTELFPDHFCVDTLISYDGHPLISTLEEPDEEM